MCFLIPVRVLSTFTAPLNLDPALAYGINLEREQLIQNLALAIVVDVAIKMVDVLLVAALLIILSVTVCPVDFTPNGSPNFWNWHARCSGCTATGLYFGYSQRAWP